MDRDEYADMFRFHLCQAVRWAEYPHEPYYIGQRRWTQREMLAPLVEYRLRLSKARGSLMSWVPEFDLAPFEDT